MSRKSMSAFGPELCFRLEVQSGVGEGCAHKPILKKHQALISEALLPDIDACVQMPERARDFLCAHGYVAVAWTSSPNRMIRWL